MNGKFHGRNSVTTKIKLIAISAVALVVATLSGGGTALAVGAFISPNSQNACEYNGIGSAGWNLSWSGTPNFDVDFDTAGGYSAGFSRQYSGTSDSYSSDYDHGTYQPVLYVSDYYGNYARQSGTVRVDYFSGCPQ